MSFPHVGIVLGTRPEVVKNYSIVKALHRRGIRHTVLHTNQHSDHEMHDAVFAEFDYAADEVFEGVYEIGKAITWLRERIEALGIDIVLVNGDTAAALVGAIAAMYTDRGLAHVEAGLRARDPEMLEERNRIMVDAAAHYLFTYTTWEDQRLRGNPDLRGRVVLVGNTTVDVVHDFGERLARPPLDPGYAFATLHRKELTDRPERLELVLDTINTVASKFTQLVLPMHPRTRDTMARLGLSKRLLSDVNVIDPVTALTCLAYQKHADLVLTDSGCIQEEACVFGTPCVTVRENTERDGTVSIGANVVSGFDPEKIHEAVAIQLAQRGRPFPNIYGEPGAGERIVDVIVRRFRNFRDF